MSVQSSGVHAPRSTTRSTYRGRPLTERALRINDLPACARIGSADMSALLNLGRSALYKWVREGRAPAPIAPGVWRAGDVRDFLAQQGQR
ncbi:helix-turn-helix transcriptional regulator [Zeimonas arvi]|uniref:Helix-turn-helix domain-containing protein n=1 Tax=Zeimonas arvi TaxID=2498847 RepID=A0A5C8NP50_9BURK|nr:helix-turn-helix domain-containing protein [Zeimonas arvi]TXL63554.1 helix-turn-helix domain-containing protein [Zeimonas arvi]